MNIHYSVINIEGYEFKFTDSKHRRDTCKHRKVLFDDNGQILTCKDCDSQISAYSHLINLLETFQRTREFLIVERDKLKEESERQQESQELLNNNKSVLSFQKKLDFIKGCCDDEIETYKDFGIQPDMNYGKNEIKGMLMKYKVLKITNNLAKYPECEKDTKEFPHLVDSLDDEMDLFVVDENGYDSPADDFFYMADIEEFETK